MWQTILTSQMPPNRRRQTDARFDNFISELRKARLSHREVIRSVRRQSYALLREFTELALALVKEYGHLILEVVIELVWIAFIFGTFSLFLLSGAEVFWFGLRILPNIVASLLLLVSLIVVAVSLVIIWKLAVSSVATLWNLCRLLLAGFTNPTEESDGSGQAPSAERGSVWPLVFADAGIFAALYLFAVWPPYQCRIMPLAVVQRQVYKSVSAIHIRSVALLTVPFIARRSVPSKERPDSSSQNSPSINLPHTAPAKSSQPSTLGSEAVSIQTGSVDPDEKEPTGAAARPYRSPSRRYQSQGSSEAATVISRVTPVLPNQQSSADNLIGYSFNGSRVLYGDDPSKISLTLARDVPQSFREMQALANSARWADLISVCDEVIATSPKWLTPYYFKGSAELNRGNRDLGVSLLKFVRDQSGDDPEYAKATRILQQLGIQ